MTTLFQENLYKYISEFLPQYMREPTFTEMTHAMGISARSKSLITRSLRALEQDGKLVLNKKGRRLLISLSSKHMRLLGRISAGMPIEAIVENEYIDVAEWFSGENRFALQVKGTSMIDEGILDGDIIICQHTQIAKEGDIVVALIDQQNATLKRISYKMSNLITLIPANKELKPRAYTPERIQVQGIYVGLIRSHL